MPSITPPDVCAVLFDYGQVLSLPTYPTAWAKLLSLTGASEELFHRSYWQHRDEYDRGGLSSETYWQTLAHELGFTLDADKLTALRAADIEVWGGQNEPMVAWVHQLQQRGIRTGILSNIGDAMESGLRAKHAWITDFTHCVWSHQYKIIKPAAAIYKYAIDGLGCPAANILFIDDREKYGQGAIAAGLQSIQYTTHVDFLRTMRERGYGNLLDS